MGSVLLPFRRRRFEHNLRHLFGIEYLSEEQQERIDKLQTSFEKGHEDVAGFTAKLRECLGRNESDDQAIKLAWNDIFWRNESEIWFLRRCRDQGLATVVLISNTDPWRLDHALERLELGQLFDREHVVASFDPGVNPKGTDNSMLSRGLGILERVCQPGHFIPVFIDDIREYLINAQESGIGVHQLHFRTFCQFVYELRKYGLYVQVAADF
jgi:hypothetical protein